MNNPIVSASHRSHARKPILGRAGPGVLIALAVLAARPAFAQQPTASSNGADQIVQLPTVEVNATLRSEPLLSIPVAVAVVSGDDMLQNGLEDLSDVVTETPYLTFRAGASNKDTSFLIRGVGTITTSPGTEPDVSTVIDGVVISRPGQATMDLMDVDHIEILRGPQGTLFGINSSVGVINVVTKNPGEEPAGYFDVDYFGGFGDEEIVHAGMSGALVPHKLLASVSLLYDNYGGNVQNTFLNKTVDGYLHEGARIKLLYTPNSDFKATVILSDIYSFETTPNDGPVTADTNTAFPTGAVTPLPASEAATQAYVASPNNLDVSSGLWGRVYDYNTGASVQLDWTASDYTVTSITAYQGWYNNQYEDTAIVPAPTVGQTVSWDNGYVWFNQYSQELRLTSPTGRFFDFVSGLYTQEAIDTETYTRDIIQEPTAGDLVPNTGQAHYGTHTENYSAYGEGTWNFTHAFRAITGLRLTRDTLSFYEQRVSSSAVAVPGINPTIPIHSGDTAADGLSGRVGLQLDLNKSTMAYATYTKGFKGPAYDVFFNQTALQSLALDSETSDAYEVGVKSVAFDNRLQFTADAFDTIYSNYQANFQTLIVGTPVTSLINAGQVSSKGVEADARALVTSRFTLSGSVSRDNARVDNFNTPPGDANIDGQPLPFAPTLKTNGEADYRVPLANGLALNFATDYTYQTREQFSLTETPDTVQGGYGIWNASVALAKAADGWRVALLVKNIADRHYATYIAEGGDFDWQVVPRDDDRYFGISLHKDIF